MRRYFAIFKEGVKTAFAAASTYRLNFFLEMVFILVSNILFPLVTILIYGSGNGFPGWSFYEVLLIQSAFLMSQGAAGMLAGGVLWVTMHYVVEGNFEIVLIKPVDPLFYLMAANFQVASVSTVFGGAVLLAVALFNLPAVGISQIAGFIVLFVAGVLVELGISLIMSAMSFKWVANSRLPEIFDSIRSFGKYPLGIFPAAVRAAASFVIPVAMVGFFPASVLLSRSEPYMYIAILPCIVFFILGTLLYRSMIRLYEGVGG